MKKLAFYLIFTLLVGSVIAQSASRNVLIEPYVGAWGGWNLDAQVRIDDIVSQNPSVISMSNHNGDIFEVTDGTALQNFFNVNAFPTGNIDRVVFQGETKVPHSRVSWATNTASQINAGAPLNVNISKTYNDSTRQFTAVVTASFTNAVSGDMRIHLFVIEDSLTGAPQQNYYYQGIDPNHPYYNSPSPIVNYIHRDVIRDAVTPALEGLAGVIPNSVVAGSSYSQSFTYTLPQSWNDSHVSLIAFVSYYDAGGLAGNEVLNAVKCHIMDNQPIPCVADFAYSVNGLTTTFTNLSTGTFGYTWNFGDGQTSSQTNPMHTYNSAGTYNVTLYAEDGQGNICDSITYQVTLVQPTMCTAGFSYNLNGTLVTFTNSSTGDIGSYEWAFGDGDFSSQVNPVHNYASSGTYTVVLTVFDTLNQVCDIDSQSITVDIGLNCDASFTYVKTGQTVDFTNASTGNYSSLSWGFGDGNSSTTVNPTYTYSVAGTYTICLTLFDSLNNSCSETCDTIEVFPTGIDFVNDEFVSISVMPNPIKELGIIEFELKESDYVSVELWDMFGRKVKVLREGQLVNGQHRAAIDATSLAGGIYSIIIRSENNKASKRVVIIP